MTDKEEKSFSLLRKVILLVAVLVSIVAVCISLMNHFDLWGKFHDFETIRLWINSAGSFAVVVYAVLVLLQVVILPIPSTFTNLVAAMLFEPWVTFVVTTVCTVAGSFICFWLGRFFGKKLVSWLVGVEKTERYAKILDDKGRLLFVLMLLLPCFPDDILCMVAGLSTIGIGFFSASIVLARPVMIAIVSFLGPEVMNAIDSWGLPVSIGIVLLIMLAVFLVTFYRDRKSKKKERTEKITLPSDVEK